MNVPAWRASLRIARRDALRHKGRSILILAMIALPVLGVTAADVLARSAQLTPAELLDRKIGAADASFRVTPYGPLLQTSDGKRWTQASVPVGDESASGPPPAPAPAALPTLLPDLPSLLPAGSRLIPWNQASTALRDAGGGVERSAVEELDYADPLARGLFRQVDGRAPADISEVALTTRLSHNLGLGVGDTLYSLEPEHSFTIVGIVERPAGRHDATVLALPGALTGRLTESQPSDGSEAFYLGSTTHPLTWDDVQALNAHGILATARSVALDPPPRSAVPYYAQAYDDSVPTDVVAAIVVVAGMALLEVVLLAGPAFAVGARRMSRQLALVAASGGERRQVRDIVLAGGVVLGMAAGLLGGLLGLGAGLVTRALLIRYTALDFGGLHLRPLELAAIAGIGLLTGILAALLPARSASRQDVVATLGRRRGTVRVPKRWPAIGAVVFGIGAAITAYGALSQQRATVILAGSILAELGLVACTSAIVGLVGRFGSRLPATARMALRDASRNRGRTAPAVAAIMAAVTGIVALGIYANSSQSRERATYRPSLLPGQSLVSLDSDRDRDLGTQIAEAMQRTLPVKTTYVVHSLDEASCQNGADCTNVDIETPEANVCPLWRLDRQATAAEARAARDDWRCAQDQTWRAVNFGSVLVGDATIFAALTGVHDPKVAELLDAGGVVVFQRTLVADGRVTLSTVPMRTLPDGGLGTDDEARTSVELPGLAVDVDYAPARAFVSPAAAEKIGAPIIPTAVLADTSNTPTHAQEKAARAAVAAAGSTSYVTVERGYQGDAVTLMLVLLVGAVIVTLGASGIVTGLTAADSRPDMATLAAIGANPRTRRRLMAFSAAVVAFLGSILGVLAGFVPAVGVIKARDLNLARSHNGSFPVVPPWPLLIAVAVGIPLAAAAFAWLFTRSRLPMPRRSA